MKTIRVLHLLEESWPNRLGGVECFVDSLHRDLGFASTVLDYRAVFPKALSGTRSSWKLLQSMASWHEPDLPESDLVVFHQIIPWGIPWMLKLAQQRRCLFVVHDWFVQCQRVHLLNEDGPCAGPGWIKCVRCWGRGKNLLLSLGYQGVRQHYASMLAEAMPFAITQKSFFETVPEAIHFLPYGVSPTRAQIFQRLYKNEGEDLVYLGSDTVHKGLKTLIAELEISEYVKNGHHLHWFGDRTLLSDELPPWVRYHGPVLDALDGPNIKALILPSLWLETGPLVLLEALSVGLPVLAKRGSISSEYTGYSGVHLYDSLQSLEDLLKMSRAQLWQTTSRVMPIKYDHVLEQHRKTYLSLVDATF